MVARSSHTGYAPAELPRISVAGDGTLAAVHESARVTLLELPRGMAFAEIGVDPDALESEVAWVGATPRLLVLSRYALHSTVHLLDPYGPRTIAEIRLESPMRLFATVGSSALVIGSLGAAVLVATESHLMPYQFPARAAPVTAGAAAGLFVVAVAGSIEEWDPQSRMPKRRFRFPRSAAITAVGGTERLMWMTTQQEPARIDVIPLVNRGQPKGHDLPEPIARIAGHPRSDLVACVGAESGRLYVVDLDGRARLRAMMPDGLDRVESVGLVAGRAVTVLAAQAGRPIAIVALDGRDADTSAHAAIASGSAMAARGDPARPLPPIDEPEEPVGRAEPSELVELEDAAATVERDDHSGAAEIDKPAWAHPHDPQEQPGEQDEPAETDPRDEHGEHGEPRVESSIASSPAVAPSLSNESPAVAPSLSNESSAVAPSLSNESSAFALLRSRLKAPQVAASPPRATSMTGAAPPRPIPPRIASSAPPVDSPLRPPVPPPAATRQATLAEDTQVPAASGRFSAWRNAGQQDQPSAASIAPGASPDPSRAAPMRSEPDPDPLSTAPIRSRSRSKQEPAERGAGLSWRDEVVAWSRAVSSGGLDHGVPAVPAIDVLLARFELEPALQPVLALLYGAHLCGEPGAAPVDVARLLDRRWDEALGRGALAQRGVARYASSRVALSPVLLRVLDELPPTTGTLIGEPGPVALLGPCVVIAGDEPVTSVAERCLPRVQGAILVANDGADRAELYFEARAFGAVPMLRISTTVDPSAGDPALLVVGDPDLAERLCLPVLS